MNQSSPKPINNLHQCVVVETVLLHHQIWRNRIIAGKNNSAGYGAKRKVRWCLSFVMRWTFSGAGLYTHVKLTWNVVDQNNIGVYRFYFIKPSRVHTGYIRTLPVDRWSLQSTMEGGDFKLWCLPQFSRSLTITRSEAKQKRVIFFQ